MTIIDEPLLDLFRGHGRCEFCGLIVSRREPHHVTKRGMGGGSRLDIRLNLVALCGVFCGGWNCHANAENGGRPNYWDCVAIIAKREGCSVEEVRETVWRILRERK